MSEEQLDLWAEWRLDVVALVEKLEPEEALEVLRRVVAECTESHQVAPVLIGTIRGVVERRKGHEP